MENVIAAQRPGEQQLLKCRVQPAGMALEPLHDGLDVKIEIPRDAIRLEDESLAAEAQYLIGAGLERQRENRRRATRRGEHVLGETHLRSASPGR